GGEGAPARAIASASRRAPAAHPRIRVWEGLPVSPRLRRSGCGAAVPARRPGRQGLLRALRGGTREANKRPAAALAQFSPGRPEGDKSKQRQRADTGFGLIAGTANGPKRD